MRSLAFSPIDENEWSAMPDGNGARSSIEDALDQIEQGAVIRVSYEGITDRRSKIMSFCRRAGYRGLRLDKRWTDSEIAFKLRP